MSQNNVSNCKSLICWFKRNNQLMSNTEDNSFFVYEMKKCNWHDCNKKSTKK